MLQNKKISSLLIHTFKYLYIQDVTDLFYKFSFLNLKKNYCSAIAIVFVKKNNNEKKSHCIYQT